MDSNTTIKELKDKVKKFCDDRDWAQFHNAKDVAIDISVEASELLERFLYKNEEEITELFSDAKNREKISEEAADTLFALLNFCQRFDIDISEELNKKIAKNIEKYPIEISKGNNKKQKDWKWKYTLKKKTSIWK